MTRRTEALAQGDLQVGGRRGHLRPVVLLSATDAGALLLPFTAFCNLDFPYPPAIGGASQVITVNLEQKKRCISRRDIYPIIWYASPPRVPQQFAFFQSAPG